MRSEQQGLRAAAQRGAAAGGHLLRCRSSTICTDISCVAALRRRKAKKKEAGGSETTTGSGTESGTQAEETSTATLGSKSGMVLAVTLAGNRRREFLLRSI